MKRPVSYPLIIAALAAVVLLPISEAQAETVDELRKRALQAIADMMDSVPLSMWSIKSLRKSGGHATKDKRSKVKSISCTEAPERSVVLHLEFYEEGQKPWTTKITISDKVQFFPADVGDVFPVANKYIDEDRPISVMVSIESGSPHLKAANLKSGVQLYADFPKYSSYDNTNSSDIRLFVLKASNTDGLLKTGQYGEVYQIPVRRFSVPAAFKICREINRDALEVFAKNLEKGVYPTIPKQRFPSGCLVPPTAVHPIASATIDCK